MALAVFVTLMILEELALVAYRQPVGFGEYLGTFFYYWWPYAITFVVGVLVYFRTPRNWFW